MIKAVIFDFDGVIVNDYSIHYELSQKQITNLTEDEFKKLFEGNIHAEREKLKSRDTGYDLKDDFNEHKKTILIKSEIRKELQKLSKKYILGIISSAKEGGIIECIKKNNLNGVFSFIHGYETDKLKAKKFEIVLQTFNVSKEECIFITDTLGDILEAQKVGIKTIAVDYGYHDKKTLLKGKPLTIISSLTELNNTIINKLPA